MPSDEKKAFLLRIDPTLWADLEAWAADELRSVNGQLEYLLREAVRRRRSASLPAPSNDRVDPASPKREAQ